MHESRVGDVFQLGSSTWRISAIEHDRVIVTPAPGAPARMPFWHGEYSARSAHLAHARRRAAARARRRAHADEQLRGARRRAITPTRRRRARSSSTCTQQRAATGVVPDERDARRRAVPRRDGLGAHRAARAVRRPRERAVGDGARAARARWLRAGRSARRSGIEVQVQTTDDGIMLRLPEPRRRGCRSRVLRALDGRRSGAPRARGSRQRRRCSARASA